MEKVQESYQDHESSFEYNESIKKNQYRVYDPPQRTSLNQNGEIRIQILNEDIWKVKVFAKVFYTLKDSY